MKTTTYLCLITSGLLFVLQSCSPIIYSATGANTPMFTQKGEFTVTASSSSSSGPDDLIAPLYYTGGSGFAGQAAYSISDKWAAIASFYSMKNSHEPGEDDWISKGSYAEFGGGRYGVSKNKKFAWEAFGGMGFGKNTNNQKSNQVDATHLKYLFSHPAVS